MNELEQRIYRDATRAASEVSAADIPPLRLPYWRGTRRGTAKIVAPLAAAASVAALVAVLVTVGHGSPAPAHARPPTAPARPASVNWMLGAWALNWYFPASGETYTQGLAFSWMQAKVTAQDIDPCLAAAGFPQPPFAGSRQLYQLSFQNNSQFPDLAQLAANPGPHNFTKQYLVLAHPTAARQRALGRAQDRCTARYAQRVTRVDRAAGPLQATWLGIISAIEHSRPVTATQPAFARCLESHGVPASLATRTDDTASNPLFYGYFFWADGLNQENTTVQRSAANQRWERRVFLACAPAVVSVLEPIQLDRRTQFFSQHAKQIARIVRLAEEVK